MREKFLSFLFISLYFSLSFGSSIDSIPLNQWPLLMTHDAATGYLHQTVVNNEIYRWTITQTENVTGQLNCGTRAFDWRPEVNSTGGLVMHHGDVIINHPMSEAMNEMVEWANQHPDTEDLVVLYVWDCLGSGCDQLALQTLNESGINGIIQGNCAELEGMTVGEASNYGKLEKGGSILVLFSCGVHQEYWSENGCSGFINDTNPCPSSSSSSFSLSSLSSSSSSSLSLSSSSPPSSPSSSSSSPRVSKPSIYTCYQESETRWLPYGRMSAYLIRTSHISPPENGFLWENQALWQETSDSVTVGELHDSSLVKDEERSHLNAYVLNNLEELKTISFLEVNNVCDRGPDILAALRQRVGL